MAFIDETFIAEWEAGVFVWFESQQLFWQVFHHALVGVVEFLYDGAVEAWWEVLLLWVSLLFVSSFDSYVFAFAEILECYVCELIL